MRTDLLRRGALVGMAVAAALVVAVPANATEPGAGSAYGADAEVHLLPNVLGPGGLTVSTGQLAASSTSGPTSATTVDAALRGLVHARVITSSAVHSTTDGSVTAQAALVDAALPVLATLAGRTPTASVISSQCHATANGITASSDLADLNLGRIGHISAATPNLTIGVPGVVKIVANEQIPHADGSLTVNALHITLLGGEGQLSALGSGDIVLASSTCGPATTVSTPPSSPSTPSSPTTAPTKPEVSVVPSGAPETGDGSLATLIVH